MFDGLTHAQLLVLVDVSTVLPSPFSLDLGGWSDANVTTGQQQRESSKNISCSSTHLTSFAVLVDVSGLINVRINIVSVLIPRIIARIQIEDA